MNTASHVAETLRNVLANPSREIVALVDDLLAVCGEHELQLDWQPNHCRVRAAGGEWEELVELPLRKSAFRAILARIAVLCSQANGNAASPFGGEGRIVAPTDPPHILRVVFANTPDKQRLQMSSGNCSEWEN